MRRLIVATAIACVVIGLWYLGSYLLHSSGDVLAGSKLPYPHDIASRFINYPDTLLEATWASVSRAVLGFAVGALVGIALSLVMLRAGWLEASIMPYVLFVQMIPLIALVPILRAMTRNDDITRVLLAAFVTFFSVTIATVRGLKATDRDALELMHALDAGWLKTTWRLRFPAALPYIFSGLKIAAPLSIVGAIVVDLMGARTGLGYLMLSALTFGPRQATMLWAAMLITLVAGWCFSAAVGWAERRLSPWQPAFRNDTPAVSTPS